MSQVTLNSLRRLLLLGIDRWNTLVTTLDDHMERIGVPSNNTTAGLTLAARPAANRVVALFENHTASIS